MKNLVSALFVCVPFLSFAQSEANLLGHWHDENIVPAFFDNPYHDVWGTEINGIEYGIICSTDGFHFFDLTTQPMSEEPVAFSEGTIQGSQISHRDIKTYQNYLYAVSDEGASTLQIFDLSGLPDTATLVYESNEFLTTAHNLFIDEDNARLYAVGGNGFNVKILSLANPEVPTEMASYPNANYNISYVHDLYVRDHIAYLNAGNSGLVVTDFTDTANPDTLGTLTDYPEQGYNHSGWLSDDGQHYYMCDETHGTDIKVVDVSDYSDMEAVAFINAASTENQIVHNVYVQGNLLYASYYYDGLQVFDISNPLLPTRIGYYDTTDEPNSNYFAGAWGIFVLPSGLPLISDMQTGLYMFDEIELPVNVKESIQSNAFSTTPNPATNLITLQFENPLEKGLNIELMSINGQKTGSFRMEPQSNVFQIPVNNLAEGIYILRLTSGENTASKKILIQH